MKSFILPETEFEETVLKTVRIKVTTLKRIENLSKNKNLSVNRIINECITYALNNLEEQEKE